MAEEVIGELKREDLENRYRAVQSEARVLSRLLKAEKDAHMMTQFKTELAFENLIAENLGLLGQLEAKKPAQ